MLVNPKSSVLLSPEFRFWFHSSLPHLAQGLISIPEQIQLGLLYWMVQHGNALLGYIRLCLGNPSLLAYQRWVRQYLLLGPHLLVWETSFEPHSSRLCSRTCMRTETSLLPLWSKSDLTVSVVGYIGNENTSLVTFWFIASSLQSLKCLFDTWQGALWQY